MQRSRGSGPGGRHRNSTESRVVLRHRPSGLTGLAGERRSQHENLALALRRLRLALATELRVTRAAAAQPSPLWRSRARGGRIVCSLRHPDHPLVLAEALDTLAGRGWDARAAAVQLAVSPTQLVRFVASHPPALVALNRERAARSLPPLRA